MSTWTHVAGVVRVDAMRMGMATEVNWDDIFGKECLWEDTQGCHCDACLNYSSINQLRQLARQIIKEREATE